MFYYAIYLLSKYRNEYKNYFLTFICIYRENKKLY